MTTVRLNDNMLTGTLPATAGMILPKLQVMMGARNRFTGPIPDVDMYGMKLHLQHWDYAENLLTGTLPRNMATFANLISFNVSHNPGMTGTVPTKIGLLRNLTYFGIENTGITGTIPDVACELPMVQFDTDSDKDELYCCSERCSVENWENC